MHEILFKDLKIEHLVKKSLKHSYISIKPNADTFTVLLKTPKVSQKFVENLLLEKEPWMRRQISKLQDKKQLSATLEDEVLLFGEIYSIDSQEATLLREKLQKIAVDDSIKIAKSYDTFYKKRAKEYISKRLEYFSKLMSLEYSELKFRKMKSRWGSCNSLRVITFNSELIKLSKELIDYVVVHELAHLTHMNHSKEFHSLVDMFIDDSKAIRKELKSVYLEYGIK